MIGVVNGLAIIWLSLFPKTSGSQNKQRDTMDRILRKLTYTSLKSNGKNGTTKEDEALNKVLELEKIWRIIMWNNIINPRINPRLKWLTKIRLIITSELHQINEVSILPKYGIIDRILIITVIPQ